MPQHKAVSRLGFIAAVLTTLTVLTTQSASAQTDAPQLPPRKAPPVILLKVDDLSGQNGSAGERWQRLVDFLKARKIKANIGIICDSLEGDHSKYIQWIKDQQATGLFEFWNHGYDHKEWEENGKKVEEFKGPAYEQQKDHLAHSERLIQEKLGFPIPAFGAPFNATDANTVRALQEDPIIKVWLYGEPKTPAGKVVLDRIPSVNIENPIFHPSLEKFIEGYAKYPNRAYFLIQGHPGQWDEARFAEFVRLIDFLTQQNATFTTVSEYARQVGGQTEIHKQ